MPLSEDEQYRNSWNERYNEPGFAYGKTPNLFFKSWLETLEPGRILLPADGEGRNGVFAAQLGWQVTATDLSITGRTKALQLAREQGVTLDYQVGDLEEMHFEPSSFDVIALIYAHFTAAKKSLLHRRLDTYLRPGGTLIFEAFSKAHLPLRQSNPAVGGPQDIDMLCSETELKADFPGYDIHLLRQEEIALNEGKYHIGTGSVIRFAGRKL
ncbi:class I SAM-dependent methyltransferase [Taibaiella chishuiensis]|uniref:Methyltransferase family protein n=1 Tax=Taibaiella chishuiensis TaxID=1434707 RepID=A0A2P8D1G5_9BACT|nr:class I SAM-dependent methyltransferase [Taibaiella chishuiensis]PSK91057.1 methyltransferase family protein [Taibaiella chishuiensis]